MSSCECIWVIKLLQLLRNKEFRTWVDLVIGYATVEMYITFSMRYESFILEIIQHSEFQHQLLKHIGHMEKPQLERLVNLQKNLVFHSSEFLHQLPKYTNHIEKRHLTRLVHLSMNLVFRNIKTVDRGRMNVWLLYTLNLRLEVIYCESQQSS